MRRPFISLLVAIGLFLLGSMSLATFTPSKTQVAADGTITRKTETERRLAELRVNWFAYLCFAGAATSFAWTVYLVSAAIVCIVRARLHDNADDSGADGIRTDRDGRLYAATRLGIQVCEAGRVQCILPTPNGKVANLCFGGENFDTLFATCGDKVFKRKLKVHGAQAWDKPNKPASPRL